MLLARYSQHDEVFACAKNNVYFTVKENIKSRFKKHSKRELGVLVVAGGKNASSRTIPTSPSYEWPAILTSAVFPLKFGSSLHHAMHPSGSRPHLENIPQGGFSRGHRVRSFLLLGKADYPSINLGFGTRVTTVSVLS